MSCFGPSEQAAAAKLSSRLGASQSAASGDTEPLTTFGVASGAPSAAPTTAPPANISAPGSAVVSAERDMAISRAIAALPSPEGTRLTRSGLLQEDDNALQDAIAAGSVKVELPPGLDIVTTRGGAFGNAR